MGCVGTKQPGKHKPQIEPVFPLARSVMSIVSERQTVTIYEPDRVSHKTVGISYITYGKTATQRDPTVRLIKDDELHSIGASMSRRSHKPDFTEYKSGDNESKVVLEKDLVDQLSLMKQSAFHDFELAGFAFNPEDPNQSLKNSQVYSQPKQPDYSQSRQRAQTNLKDPLQQKASIKGRFRPQLGETFKSKFKDFNRTRTITQNNRQVTELDESIIEEKPEEDLSSPFKKSVTTKFKQIKKPIEESEDDEDSEESFPNKLVAPIVTMSIRRRRSSTLIGLDLAQKVND